MYISMGTSFRAKLKNWESERRAVLFRVELGMRGALVIESKVPCSQPFRREWGRAAAVTNFKRDGLYGAGANY